MRRSCFLLLAACVAMAPAAPARAWDGLFRPAVDYDVADDARSLAIGDLDGDGDLDLAVTNWLDNSVSVLLANGDGTFQPAANYQTGSGARSVVMGYFDANDDLDLAVANNQDDDVSVLLGHGDGTFGPAMSYTAASLPLAIATADIDENGHADLVVANGGGNNVSVLRGNGDGTFQSPVNSPAGTNPRSVAIADLDGDGHRDLVVTNYYDDAISILFGAGDGTFATPVSYGAGVGPSFGAIGHLNGDDHWDLAVCNYTSGNVSVLLGNGDGTFQWASNYSVGPQGPRSVAIAELDGFPGVDLVTANEVPGSISVLPGTGYGSFGERLHCYTGDSSWGVGTADLDGDGNTDVAVANRISDDVSVLLSIARPSFMDIADVGNDQGGQVRLEWRATSYDGEGSPAPVTGYGVYRRQDEFLRGPDGNDRPPGWDYLVTVPAHGDPSYQCVVPALCDSTEQGGVCWSVFSVRAETREPLVYIDSAPDSGYSVDNLAPEPPPALRGDFDPEVGSVALSWAPSPSGDLQYYELHRGEGPDFTPGTANRIYAGADTFYVDVSSEWDETTYYKAAAVDFGGNRSEYAWVSAPATGVHGEDSVRSLAVFAPRPNPFGLATTLAYDLPEPTRVSLRIFGASGRVVRTLLDGTSRQAGRHAVSWDGRDDNGRSVASGVYFLRVEAYGSVLTEPMVLLR